MSGLFEKIAAAIAAQKKRIATIALGQTFDQLFNWAFNYPLYMFVIGWRGLNEGYVIMTITSFLTCLVFLRFYDWLKVDWLGIEVAKKVRDLGPDWIKKIQAKSFLGKILWWPFSKMIYFVLWSLKKGGIIAFLALSIYTDPFIVTVYMRKGWGEFSGLTRRDWGIFLASTVVSNGYWTIRTFAILESAKALWNSLF